MSGLFSTLVDNGYKINNIQSANGALQELYFWERYDILIVDFLLPLANNNGDFEFRELFPNLVNEPYLGIELIKHARLKLKAKNPILIFTAVNHPLNHVKIQNLENIFSISKLSRPSMVLEAIKIILDSQNEQLQLKARN